MKEIKRLELTEAVGRSMSLMFFALWLIETAYFGWNKSPCCTAELWCDRVTFLGMIIGHTITWNSVKELRVLYMNRYIGITSLLNGDDE